MKRTLPLALLVGACLPGSALAQTAPTAPAKPAVAADGTITLNPFEVTTTKDYGYRAGSSLSGTGTAGAIKDTPMTISVLTSEFITDSGGDQLVDYLRAVPTLAAHVKDDSVLTVRGFSAVVFRNGLPIAQGYQESYDIDRIEVVKGANAVFAGSGSPGGTINFIKAQPTFHHTGSLALTGGDRGNSKTIFRSSGPLLANKVAYNFVFGNLNKETGVQYMHIDERFYSAGLTYAITPRLKLNAYASQLKRAQGRRPYLTVSNPLFQRLDKEAIALYDSKGLPRPRSYPLLQVNQVPGITTTAEGTALRTVAQGPEDVQTFIARSVTDPVSRLVDVYTINAYSDFTGTDNPYVNTNGPQGAEHYFNQEFGTHLDWIASESLAFKISYNQSKGYRERVEFNGFRPVAGQVLRSNSSDQFVGGGGSFNLKTEGHYRKKLGAFGDHNLLFGYQYNGGWSLSGTQSVASAIVLYNPRTEPPLQLLDLIRRTSPALVNFNGLRHTIGFVRNGGHTSAEYGVLQSAFWQDRVRTIVGARRVDQWTPLQSVPIGNSSQSFVKTVPQYSALFRVTPELSVFASHSEVFRQFTQRTVDLAAVEATQGPPTNPNYRPPTVIPFRNLIGSIQGKGDEIGLKFDLGENFTTQVSLFKNSESGIYQQDQTLANLYQIQGGQIFSPGGSNGTKGIEGELMWSPVRNYQAVVSYSYYFYAKILTDVTQPLNIGHGLETVPKHSINLWNKYVFTSGRLKGAYFGGGFNLMGPIQLHPNFNVTLKSPTSVVWSVLAGYPAKLGGVPLDFRVNVLNLTDKLYYNGTFEYGDPRSFTLTVSTKW